MEDTSRKKIKTYSAKNFSLSNVCIGLYELNCSKSHLVRIHNCMIINVGSAVPKQMINWIRVKFPKTLYVLHPRTNHTKEYWPNISQCLFRYLFELYGNTSKQAFDTTTCIFCGKCPTDTCIFILCIYLVQWCFTPHSRTTASSILVGRNQIHIPQFWPRQ